MRARLIHLVGLSALVSLAPSALAADSWFQTEDLILAASDEMPADVFGWALDVDGDTLVVGAPGVDDAVAGAGAVYVLVRNGTSWVEQAKLLGTGPNSQLGYDVAIDGDTVVAGAPFNGQGSAMVFVRTGTRWTVEAQLVPFDGAGGDFGESVAIQGDTIVVGSPGGNPNSAYVYVRTGSTWTGEAKLTGDLVFDDVFGLGVALFGPYAAVGAFRDHDQGINAGACYVFERSGTVWTRIAKLFGSTTSTSDNFGYAVAGDGDTLVVGARNEDVGRGSATVFVRNGSAWVEQAVLVATDPVVASHFGIDVTIDGERVLVGADFADGVVPDAGAAYAYVRDGSSWSERAKFVASDGAFAQALGTSVALQGDEVFAGKLGDVFTPEPSPIGRVYAFSLPTEIGTAVCFGDGSGTPCPCGNDSPVAGAGCVHSGGVGMTIAGGGSASLARGNLTLTVDACPPGNTGLFVAGTLDGSPGMPLYDGLLCIAGISQRYRGRNSGTGTVSDTYFARQDPYASFLQPGVTYVFQYFSRDNQGPPSPCGNFANLSPAYAVTMEP